MRAAVLTIALVACGGSRPVPLSNRAGAAVTPAAEVGEVGGAGSAAGEPVAESGEPRPTGVAATLAKLEQFSDDMCGCQDRDCADRVVDDMARWAQELVNAGEANPQVDLSQDARAKAAAQRVSRCMHTVYAKRGTGTPRQ